MSVVDAVLELCFEASARDVLRFDASKSILLEFVVHLFSPEKVV